MSYPIRAGIWFQDEDDLNKVAADMKDKLIDEIDKDHCFIYWETYKHHDVEVFENIAKKYPKMTCMGFSQYCGFGGGEHLSITVNRGHVDIQESLEIDDPADYGWEEEDEEDIEEPVKPVNVHDYRRVVNPF